MDIPNNNFSISRIFETYFPELSKSPASDPLKRLVESLEKSHKALENYYERLFRLYQDSFPAQLHFLPLPAQPAQVQITFTPFYCTEEVILSSGTRLSLPHEDKKYIFELSESVSFSLNNPRVISGFLYEQKEKLFLNFLEGVPFESVPFPQELFQPPSELWLEKPDGSNLILPKIESLNSREDGYINFSTYGGALIPNAHHYIERFRRGIQIYLKQNLFIPSPSTTLLPKELSVNSLCTLRCEKLEWIREGTPRESGENYQKRFKETLNLFYKFKSSYQPSESFRPQFEYFKSVENEEANLSKKEVFYV